MSSQLTEEQKFFTEKLKERIQNKFAKQELDWKAIPGLNLTQLTTDTVNQSCFYTLSVALILQGNKKVSIGNTDYRYGQGSMVVTSIDVPASFEILGASESCPFISLSLKLDPAILSEIMHDLGDEVKPLPKGNEIAQSFCVTETPYEILQTFDTLVGLLDDPIKRKALLPIVLKELHCLLYLNAQNLNLRQLCDVDSAPQRIQKSVSWIRNHFREPLKVEVLADLAHMAPSTFHLHFKKVTSVSPLQYQKILRLHEAKRLMVSELANATTAAFAVGYESPQQFNREYKRLFGEAPRKSVKTDRLATA